jgi:hypothetical protein
MWKTMVLFTALYFAQLAMATPTITVCYTDVTILGRLEDLDGTIRKIAPIYEIHGRIHRAEADHQVSINFLASITATDAGRAREQTESEFVKKIILMAAPPSVLVATEFQGCKDDGLKP